MSKINFVNLHGHTTFSVFDGFGYPSEHMDFAYLNGSKALAITDHGHMNAFSYQYFHWKKMKSEGKAFKAIYGIEAYFVSSIEKWHKEYEKVKQDKKKAKSIKKNDDMSIEDEEASKKEQKNILNRRRHLILLAKNREGLENIFQLVTKSYDPHNFYRYPRMDFDMLREHSEGVLCATACLGGPLSGDYWENRDKGDEAVLEAMRSTVDNFVSIYGDKFYGELQWNSIPEQHIINQFIIKVCQEKNVKLISTADSHYPSPDKWKEREIYKKLGWLGRKKAEEIYIPDSVEEIGYELYPKNGEQMWEAYQKYSKKCGFEYDDDLILSSITNTHNIAFNIIEDFEPDTSVKLPDFVIPSETNPDEYMHKLALNGLRERNLDTNQQYIDRLNYEIDIIKERGFSQYFLTTKAIIDLGKKVMLMGLGRGSAAGSLLAYVLGITQIDPIKYGLLFERFLTKGSSGMPDIDMDFESRDKVQEILIKEWGEESVAPISNYNKLNLKSLLKDVAKLYGIAFTEVNVVTGKMDKEAMPAAKKKNNIKSGVYTPTFEEYKIFSKSLSDFIKKYPKVGEHIETLLGQVRSLGRHAGGIVITNELSRYMPLVYNKGVRQTPWSEGQHVRHLEPLGFVKFDILGIETLQIISSAIRRILRRKVNIKDVQFDHIEKFYNKFLHPDVINFEDQKVYENVFHNGNFCATFQFTNPDAQKFCVEAKPKSLTDLAVITSIYRPGPLGINADQKYIESKNNPGTVKYINKKIEEVLGDTYGLIVFQEQLALLAHKLGKDIDLDEGNLLRKVLTKKGTGKEEKKSEIKRKFIEGCVSMHGLRKTTGEELWKQMEFFAQYGFNKSHAICYSGLSFQCAWLWTYHPEEWMAACLDILTLKKDKKEDIISDAKRYGFKISNVDINRSGAIWEILEDNKTLIPPLSSIKGLGEAAIEQIVLNRPYNVTEDLIFNKNIIYRKVNKKILDVLARSGALDRMIQNDGRFTGNKHWWAACVIDKPKSEKKLLENMENYRDEGMFSISEKVENIASLTGSFPLDMVLTEAVKQRLAELKVPSISDFDENLKLTWFIPRSLLVKKTKRGKTFWIVNVTDNKSANIDIKVWGVSKNDRILFNRPYVAILDYDPKWGFSMDGFTKNAKLIG